MKGYDRQYMGIEVEKGSKLRTAMASPGSDLPGFCRGFATYTWLMKSAVGN